MKPLHVDDVRDLLPEVDVLRPLLDRILATARSDPDRRWSASGELETLGQRRVDLEALRSGLPELLDSMRAHTHELYQATLEAMDALSKGAPEDASGALLRAAELERAAGRLTEAEAFAEAAIQVGERFRHREHAIPALMAGARIARARGQWRQAEARYREAGRVAAAVGDREAAAHAAIGWGNLAVDRGLWTEALARYDTAEAWIEKADRPIPAAWHLALNRSIATRRQGRLDEADAELARARSLAEQTGEEGARAILDHALGRVLQAQGRAGEAELAFRSALEDASEPDALVTISLSLADALLEQGRILEAGEVLRSAEQTALRNSVIPRLPELYTGMGRMTEARGHSDAFVFFERALGIVDDRALPSSERARVLEAYAAYELRRGEGDSGNAFLTEASRIYQELGNEVDLERVEALRRDNADQEE